MYSDKPPGSIRLLPGYTHRVLDGADTEVGEISKPDGLRIRYDIGKLAGNQAEQEKPNSLWFKEQNVGGSNVLVVLNRDRMLFVSFPETFANFITSVGGEEQITDALLMLLTYPPAG